MRQSISVRDATRSIVILLACSLLPLAGFVIRAVQTPSTALVSKPDVDSVRNKACLSAGCHPVAINGRTPQHSPYLEGHCRACHLDHASTGTALLKSRDNTMCLTCHSATEVNPKDRKLRHPPGGGICLDCHNPHQSRVRNLLRDDNRRLICAQCHATFLKKMAASPYRHHYFDPKTECGTCHYAHQRASHHYLREDVAETCLTCHDIPIRVGTRALENVAERLRTAPHIHQALEKGSCPVCHTPHGSEQPSLLLAGYPAGNYETYRRDQYALCWQCHSASLAENSDGEGVTKFRDKNKNLHWLHVGKIRHGRACHLCHEPHASDRPHLIRETTQFNQWPGPLNYKSTEDGGSCQTPCHREKIYRRK